MGPERRRARYLVKLGMTPLEAIEATTATGPLTLGPQAPRSGRLAEGYDADVITLDADPLADIAVLADPDRITGGLDRRPPAQGRGSGVACAVLAKSPGRPACSARRLVIEAAFAV